jgi:hypothetical protein
MLLIAYKDMAKTSKSPKWDLDLGTLNKTSNRSKIDTMAWRGYLVDMNAPCIIEIEQQLKEILQKLRKSPQRGRDLGALNKIEHWQDNVVAA